MTVAALSGLSQRECMLSWLLSQVSGFVVLFHYGSASLWQWRQNLFMCLITSFLCSLFLSAGAERHRRICVLLAAETTLTSMSQQCIEARRKWIEKVHTLNPLATCVLSGIRREVQLRNILAVSIDAISRVSVSSDGIVCLHLPAGSPEKERFKSFVGEDVPPVFDDLVLQADKDRWRSYVMRCKGVPECNNSSSLEVTRLQLHNLVAEVVLSVDNENGGHSFLALRHVQLNDSIPCDMMNVMGISAEPDSNDEFSLLEYKGQSNCISKSVSVMLSDGRLVPACNLCAGDKVLAMDVANGELAQGTITKIEEYSVSNALRQVSCTNDVQATCTADHLVARRGEGMSHQQVPAEALSPGDRVTVVELRDETVIGVQSLQEELAEVLAINLEQDGLHIFAADSRSRAALALRPNMHDLQHLDAQHTAVRNQVGNMQNSHVSDDEDARSSILSSISSSAVTSSDGKTVIKVGPRFSPDSLALSFISSIPYQPAGCLTSHGSRNHPSSCRPCKFQARKKGCADGVLCDQCHLHSGMTYSARRRAGERQHAETTEQTRFREQSATANVEGNEEEQSPGDFNTEERASSTIDGGDRQQVHKMATAAHDGCYLQVKNTFIELKSQVLPGNIRRASSAPCLLHH